MRIRALFGNAEPQISHARRLAGFRQGKIMALLPLQESKEHEARRARSVFDDFDYDSNEDQEETLPRSTRSTRSGSPGRNTAGRVGARTSSQVGVKVGIVDRPMADCSSHCTASQTDRSARRGGVHADGEQARNRRGDEAGRSGGAKGKASRSVRMGKQVLMSFIETEQADHVLQHHDRFPLRRPLP